MADLYVSSVDGDDGDNGSSWALAKATLAGAFAAGAAGDIIHVDDAHAETQESAMTLACPGTVAAPCLILCEDRDTGALAATATITVTGDFDMTFSGNAYVHGITFQIGSGAVNVNGYFGSGAVALGLVFSSCTFSIVATGTSSRLYFGGTTRDTFYRFYNCTLKLGNASQRVLCRGWQEWWGGSVDVTTAIPTGVFNTEPAYGCEVTIHGMDFSGCTGALVIAGNNDLMRYRFHNCKLHASTTAKTATAIAGPGAGQVILDNCHSGDVNYNLHHEKFQGTIDIETTIVRTGGASDGTTPFSWKMVTLAAGPQFFWPLESPPIAVWNESVGSEMTLTVEVIHDSLTNLQDDEIWVEVEYLGTSGFPQSLLASDRMTNIKSTPADQAASSEAWTESMSNPNTQKLVATFTPQEKGLIVARVMLAKADYTVYVCPKATVA